MPDPVQSADDDFVNQHFVKEPSETPTTQPLTPKAGTLDAALRDVKNGVTVYAASKLHKISDKRLAKACKDAGIVPTPGKPNGKKREDISPLWVRVTHDETGKMQTTHLPPVVSQSSQAPGTQNVPGLSARVEWDGNELRIVVAGYAFAAAVVTDSGHAAMLQWAPDGASVAVPCRDRTEAVAVVRALLKIRGIECHE